MRKIAYFFALIGILATLVNCTGNMKIKTKPYPVARMDSTTDNYFGTEVADPYRWLEDDNSAETAQWVKAENAVTQDYLAQIPFRGAVKTRLTELWNYAKYSTPTQVGDYYFFFENDGLSNQSILYYQKGLEATPEVFLDPNTLSTDGTVALSEVSFSKDDRYMAYSVAASGSDWVEIHVMEIATKKQLDDRIEWVKFSGATWGKDGFYYSSYDAPAKGGELSAQNRFQKVYFHKLGAAQQQDQLIYEDPAHPLRYLSAVTDEANEYLFIIGSEGTSGTEVLYKPLNTPNAPFKTLFAGFENDYALIACEKGKAIFHTNDGAPNFRLVTVDLTTSKPVATDLIAETDVLLEGASTGGGSLFAFYLKNAQSVVKQCAMDGTVIREVTLPGIGTATGFEAKKTSTSTFFAFTGFTAPTSIYRYDLTDGNSTAFKTPKLTFDPAQYHTEQLFFESKDGSPVSMFVTHRNDLKLDGKNPLYLYGYGGFNISLTPGFSPQNLLFMEQGGVYVMVNLRGGGEYGEKWHKGGMLDQKQNVFDDFIGAAEHLIAKGYTAADKLAIAGGSNGGLLVGACMVQRPDLFAVALPAVGVLDMLRYHKFTIGWGWAVEYGSSDQADQFAYLYKYSPLHNIRAGSCYPATLITTGDHDDRVVPAHSFKFAATLQSAQGCDKPTLIRIDTNAGHGAGKPISKRIDEATDVLSFTFYNTNTKFKVNR